MNDNHMGEILELGRSRLKVKITTLMLIDSLEMKDGDCLKILDHCKSADKNQIAINPGTNTMTKTCGVLANAKLKKTIVLTGAMIPYRFGSSDGLFNIGGVLVFAQSLSCGVYVAMNGRYFQWDEVQKNKETGVFDPKST